MLSSRLRGTCWSLRTAPCRPSAALHQRYTDSHTCCILTKLARCGHPKLLQVETPQKLATRHLSLSHVELFVSYRGLFSNTSSLSFFGPQKYSATGAFLAAAVWVASGVATSVFGGGGARIPDDVPVINDRVTDVN